MSTYLNVVKNPTESSVIEVTKQELEEMSKKYPAISVGNADLKFIENFSQNNIVGVVAGDLKNIKDKDADLWFVNITYFKEHYTIVSDS